MKKNKKSGNNISILNVDDKQKQKLLYMDIMDVYEKKETKNEEGY
jgi:hypothetical protein